MSGDCLSVHAEATIYEPLLAPSSAVGSAVWRQLSAVEMKTGEVAQLPRGAGTLVSHLASSLLVRKVYARLWAMVSNIPGDPLLLNLLAHPLPQVATQLASCTVVASRCCVHHGDPWHWQVKHVAVHPVAAGKSKGQGHPSHVGCHAPFLWVGPCTGQLQYISEYP